MALCRIATCNPTAVGSTARNTATHLPLEAAGQLQALHPLQKICIAACCLSELLLLLVLLLLLLLLVVPCV